MRVGLVIYGSLSTTTGGFLYDRKLVEHLRRNGATVEVIDLPWRSYPRHLLDNLNRSVRERLADASVDVLLQDELCHPSLFRVNRRLDRAVPIVSIVHHLRSSESHSPPQAWLYDRIERRYLDTVDGVICSSRATCAAVERAGATAPSVVAHPGTGRFDPDITVEEIDRRARDSGPLRILFLGSVIPRKGLHTLLYGLAQLPDEAWRLTVVGDRTTAPDYVEDLGRQVDRLGIRERVRFTGHLPDEALAAELGEGQLLAVPSTYEGFGIAYLEGMGFGLPPLATAAGGAAELITDGEDGFLVPPERPDAIARRLRPLLEDRETLAEMGRAARERYESHPTWGETMETAYAYLTRMANQ